MTSTYDFSNKYVLVTGSTLGIGRAIAESFIHAGATVAMHGRSQEKVQKVAKELNELKKGKAVAVWGDMADKDGYKTIITQTEKFGDLDILVNNAGIFETGNLEGQTDESFARMMQINVFSLFSLTRHFLPKFLKKKDGRVINISSFVGIQATGGMVGYATTKSAVDGLTRNLAAHTQNTKVTVNSITAGPVDTEGVKEMPKETVDFIFDTLAKQMYLGRVIKPAEIAKVVLFIASDDGVIVNGASQRADGGLMKQF